MSNLKTFLKKHSTIPNNFIESFLSMYNPETIQTDFTIDIEKVSLWIGIKKKHLLETLYNSYVENIDYIHIKKQYVSIKTHGGNNKKHILITPDCFKRLCMRSRSKKSEEVRTYFIELESLLVKYRSVLLKGMSEEIKQMSKALKPKDPANKNGYIYVLKASPLKDSVYKIGRTKNLHKRLITYSTGTIDGVDLVFKYRTDNSDATEDCIKAIFKGDRYRKNKEIYKADINDIKAITKRCDDLVNFKRVFSKKERPEMTGGYYVIIKNK